MERDCYLISHPFLDNISVLHTLGLCTVLIDVYVYSVCTRRVQVCVYIYVRGVYDQLLSVQCTAIIVNFHCTCSQFFFFFLHKLM